MWDKHIFNAVMLKTAVVILECKFACSDRSDCPHIFSLLNTTSTERLKFSSKLTVTPSVLKPLQSPARALCSVLCLFKVRCCVFSR